MFGEYIPLRGPPARYQHVDLADVFCSVGPEVWPGRLLPRARMRSRGVARCLHNNEHFGL